MNLQTTIDLDFRGFFQWWGRELAFLIPQKILDFVSDPVISLVFAAEDNGFTLSLSRDGAHSEVVFTRQLGVADRTVYENLKNQYTDVVKANCILRLTGSQGLMKVIYLPEATLENLQEVVGFELDRYTPFQADQCYFSVIPMGKTGLGQIQVLLVVIPQSILDEQLARLNNWEVKPLRVELASVNQAFPQLKGQYNLLPLNFRPKTNRLAQSLHWLLNTVLFILLIAVLIYPVWQEKREVDVLKSQIKALEKETRIVDAQQLEIEALREETQRLIGIKTQTPEMAAVLNEISHLLKDDTWLTNLQYSEKHMQIQGQSPLASALIGILEASPYFSKVSFVSPLTQDKTTGLERFQISMEVSAKPPEIADPATATVTNPDEDLAIEHKP